jgi:hypothetical protein
MTATGRSSPTYTVFALDADGPAATDGEAAGEAVPVAGGATVAGDALVGDPPEQATTSRAARHSIQWRVTGRIFG